MARHLAGSVSLLALVAISAGILPSLVAMTPAAIAYSALPLRFEADPGQTDIGSRFVARSSAGTVLLDVHGAIIRARGGSPIRMEWIGSQASPAEPLDQLVTRSNYFVGRDPSRWRRDVPNFGRVRYRAVWPGIDLVYYGSGNRLEYDFVVSPGADPRAIRLAVESAGAIRLTDCGDLLLAPAVQQHRPRIYQETPAGKRWIAGRYVLEAGHRVRFQIGRYDRRLPLVIDPVLTYSTLFGGSGNDTGTGIAVDLLGNAYITGTTDSSDLPAGPSGTRFQGAAPDAFVAKVKPDGTGLLYCTYIGGEGDDEARAIAVDAAGDAYITGVTFSTQFPVTGGALQSSYVGKGDVFVARLGSGGNLVFATYLGSSGAEEGRSIALDSSGNAYITGVTNSLNFPLSASPYQARNKGGAFDGFVVKVNPLGTILIYSTLLGSSGDDEPAAIAVDSQGNAYVAGTTDGFDFPTTQLAYQPSPPNSTAMAFVTKFDPSGSTLVYSTFVAGSTNDKGTAIAVDTGGNAYVAGISSSSDFPATDAAYQPAVSGPSDAFIAKINPSGGDLAYATLLGGSGADGATAIAVDQAGNAYLAGDTQSANFPTSAASFQAVPAGGSDAFVAKLSADGTTLLYSSYLGGSADEHARGIAVDLYGDAYVIGTTLSSNFPTTAGALRITPGATDCFIARVTDARFPSLAADSLSLLFGYNVTQAMPPPRTVQLTSTAGALTFAASTSGGNWLTVQAPNGTTPATISVVANPVNLAIGAYKGSVVITASGAANSPLTIPVELDVMQSGLPPAGSDSVTPMTIRAGSGATAITVNGTGFTTASVVKVSGVAVSTTYVNSSTLTAVIPAGMLATPGSLTVTVVNPVVGTSASMTVTVTPALPVISTGGVVNGASFLSGPVAPGEVVLIRGSMLGPETGVQAADNGTSYATTLAGTRVFFGRTAAPLVYASSTQVIAVVPFEVAGSKSVQARVEYNNARSDSMTLEVAATAPGMFTEDASGVGQAQATNQDGSFNDAFSPAPAGSAVTFTATGGGQTSPGGVDGAILNDTLPALLQPVSVKMDGVTTQVVSAGPMVGMVSGILQITAIVPPGVSGTVSLLVTIGGVESQGGVTVAVQVPQPQVK